MKIVMVDSTSYRQATRLGSHAIAHEFTRRGGDLVWIGAPLYPHFLLSRARRDRVIGRRVEAWRRGGLHNDDGTTEYYPLTFLPAIDRPFFRSMFVARNTLRFTVPPIRRAIRRLGFESPDILWLSSSRITRPIMPMFRPRVTGMRIADDYVHFTNVPASLDRLQDEAIARVDAVFVTSRLLEARIAKQRPDVIYLPNAVSDAFFAAPAPEPDWLRAFARPRVLFVGSLGDWVDQDVIARVAERHPGASVIVIGPGRARRAFPANVHLAGPRAYETLPAVLQHGDTGIVPFRRSALTDSVNPLKLYEYLATGLPVVATRTHELETMDAPVTLCDTADGFADAVGAVLDRDPGGHAARVAFARRHTWAQRFEIVFRALGISDTPAV